MRGSCRPIRWIYAVLLFLAVASSVWAQKHERKRLERAEIARLEQQWRQAQLAQDITTMDHLLADDFLGITAAGQVVTKAQQLDRMRSRQLDITKLDITDTKIKISGRLAVVTSLVKLDGTSNGAPLQGYFRYTRVYQHEPGDGWKITNFEATRVPNVAGVYGSSSPKAHSAVPPAVAPSSAPASRGGPGSPQPQS